MSKITYMVNLEFAVSIVSEGGGLAESIDKVNNEQPLTERENEALFESLCNCVCGELEELSIDDFALRQIVKAKVIKD